MQAAREGDRATPSSVASGGNPLDFSEIDQKQMELRGAVENRIATLERSLLAREQKIHELQTQLRRLEEDYQYNFNLITERDRAIEEAAAYVVKFDAQLKQAKDELSTTRQHVATLEEQRRDLREQLRLQQSQADTKLMEMRRQVEAIQQNHRDALFEKEEEMQRVKDELQQAYLARVTDDDRARSVGIAAAESRMHELEDAAHRRERSLLAELQEWKQKCDALRDECTQCKQISTESKLEHQSTAAELARLNRLLEEETSSKSHLQSELARTEAAAKAIQERMSSLVADNERLTTECHSARTTAQQLQQRLSTIDTTADMQASKFQEACEVMRKMHEDTTSRLEQTIQQLESRASKAQNEISALQISVIESVSTLEKKTLELSSSKNQLQEVMQSNIRLTADAERFRQETARLHERLDAAEAERNDLVQRLTEVQRQLTYKSEEAARDIDAAKQDGSRKVFSMQQEVSRLSRELQSSESARAALENQLQLMRDDVGLQHQYEVILREKRELQERVIQLQKTNEAIRGQVETFTSELQNDPVVKNAKLVAQQLSQAQDVIRQLQGTIQEKDEAIRQQQGEIQRYQAEILNHNGDARSLRELSAERVALHREVEELRRTNALAFSTEEEGQESKMVDALKEADFWRQRSKQLEVALSEALRERDSALRELQSATQSLQAAQSERRSLTDVNTMLKTQLKQAYADTSSVAAAKAVAAPVLATLPPNTAVLAVEKVATEHQAKLVQLEDDLVALRDEISKKRSAMSSAQRPTCSSQARTTLLQRGASSSCGTTSGSSSQDRPSALAITGVATSSAVQAVHRRGPNTVRHYGQPFGS